MTTRVKTGGRRRGSLDKSERLLVNAEMAGDLLAVYKKLGGQRWLLEYAQSNPKEFIQFGLSRLWPAPAKDDDEPSGSTFNTQVNISNLDDRDAALRIAFALAKGMHGNPALAPVDEYAPVAERVPEPDISPQEALNKWHPAPAPEPLLKPEPVDNPAQTEWAASLPLTPEERADQLLIKQTRTATLENYPGSPSEQGLGPAPRQSSGGKPSVSELRRRQLL